jgi:hypothetical protein
MTKSTVRDSAALRRSILRVKHAPARVGSR